MTTGDHMTTELPNRPHELGPAQASSYPTRDSDPPDQSVLTLAEAAARLGLDVSSVRRRAKAGQLAGAYKRNDLGGEWRIPVAAVESAQREATSSTAEAATSREAELSEQLARVTEQLAVQRALADERGRALDQLHATVRALSAGPLVQQQQQADSPTTDELTATGDLLAVADLLRAELDQLRTRQGAAKRRRWWQRSSGA